MHVTRRAVLAASRLLAAGGLTRDLRAAAQDSPLKMYYPPGFRLGVDKPDDLAPRTGDPCNLLSSGQTLQIQLSEPPRLGRDDDAVVWDGRHEADRLRILRTWSVSPR